jgi:hypothetical protein
MDLVTHFRKCIAWQGFAFEDLTYSRRNMGNPKHTLWGLERSRLKLSVSLDLTYLCLTVGALVIKR